MFWDNTSWSGLMYLLPQPQILIICFDRFIRAWVLYRCYSRDGNHVQGLLYSADALLTFAALLNFMFMDLVIVKAPATRAFSARRRLAPAPTGGPHAPPCPQLHPTEARRAVRVRAVATAWAGVMLLNLHARSPGKLIRS